MSGTKKINSELRDIKALEKCAAQFDVVGDPTRLKICWLLCKHPELSVGEIAELLDKEQSLVSHALRKLREAGVVTGRREAKNVFYSLDESPMSIFLRRSLS